MNYVLAVLAFTLPPSVAYVVTLLVQLRVERAKALNAQHDQAIVNHEQTIDGHGAAIEAMRAELAEHTRQISLLTERL